MKTTTLIIATTLLCATARAEHGDDEAQTDKGGNELPVLLPKHVDPDGHAAEHADLINPLHAASLLFPDAIVEEIECLFAADKQQRKQRPFRMRADQR